jgi:hypothetical protein
MAIIRNRNNSGKGSGFLIGVPIPAKRTPQKSELLAAALRYRKTII